MNQLTHCLAAKITGIVIFVLMCCIALISAILTYMAYYLDLYTTTWDVIFAMGEVWLMTLFDYRYIVIIILLVSILFAVLVLVFLMISAGHRKDSERIERNSLDRIPLEIMLCLEIVLFIVLFVCASMTIESYSIPIILVFGTLIYVAMVLNVLSLFLTIATRYKSKTLWRNSLLYRILRVLRQLFHCIPFVWKWTMLILAWGFCEWMMCLLSVNDTAYTFYFLLEKCAVSALLIFLVYQMRRLKEAGQEITKGNLQYRINTRHMFPALREHGENLNSIRQGISKAVEQKMKSERLKTELITNVSHDIKTPLTSIVNYVDLLKKEDIQNEKAQEYIEVLDRQSARLKKLTEDLVEASKASTGNIAVNAKPTDLGLVLEQAIGEYDERLKKNQLTTVLLKPEEEVFIMADGRLLWRILDNLMSNVCKYAMPGSRFYVTLEMDEKEVRLIQRNISQYPLNIPAEELMNRFVRGDASRSTEGSGLGLSIAQSLAQLQHGRLALEIDGDLFKSILSFLRIFPGLPVENLVQA